MSQSAADSRQSLSAEDWARAALAALARGGLDALAVEPLAREMKVTKGSFYWHFANREALLLAALELWERSEAEQAQQNFTQEPDPLQRIVKLFKQATAPDRSSLYMAILSVEDHPLVREVARRVAQRRVDYLHTCYAALGYADDEARHRARFAYATFVGNLQLWRNAPEVMPTGAALNDYFRLLLRSLVPDEGALTSSSAAH